MTDADRPDPVLTPELDVSDLAESVAFYRDVLGFAVAFDRPEDRFAYLVRDGAALMLEAAAGPGRRFRTAPLDRPYGRGVNLQIRVAAIAVLYDAVVAAKAAIVVPIEDRWYRKGDLLSGNRQFVVADPDGYLLRFYEDLGTQS